LDNQQDKQPNKIEEMRKRLQQKILNRGSYIKFKAGFDKKVLRFEPDMTEEDVQITKKNGTVLAEGQYRFWAYELKDDGQGNKVWTTELKEWTTAPAWANLVLDMFAAQFYTLEITRTGSDQNGTKYSVVPYREKQE
jgi:hypothetical protein